MSGTAGGYRDKMLREFEKTKSTAHAQRRHIPEKYWKVLESLAGLVGEGLLLHEASPENLEDAVLSSNAQVLMKTQHNTTQQKKQKQGKTKTKTKTKIQGNMAKSKKWNKTPETDPKETQIYLLPDKEFQITVIKKLNELKENTDN